MTTPKPANKYSADMWDRLDRDLSYCGGQLRVKDTRHTVANILGLIASGCEVADILRDYPGLVEADIRQCARWGAWVTGYQRVDHDAG